MRVRSGKRVLSWAMIPALGWGLLVLAWRREHSPERALAAFYRGPDEDAAEDMLMDPLILAGSRVVPLVLREVERSDMPLRRYAIGFLGNGSYTKALPTLERILGNADEIDYFRADALVSIYKIDRQHGMALAPEYQRSDDFLGYMAREVLAETMDVRDHRTFAQALLGHHD